MSPSSTSTMTSRQRLRTTLNHQQPDRVCVDFGASFVTGIHASALTRLRRAVLGDDTYRVKVNEPYQMLGEVDAALREALGIDVVGVYGRTNMFGTEQKDWKPFTMNDGTEVLVPGMFNVTKDDNGDKDRNADEHPEQSRKGHWAPRLISKPSRAQASAKPILRLPELGFEGVCSMLLLPLELYQRRADTASPRSPCGRAGGAEGGPPAAQTAKEDGGSP